MSTAWRVNAQQTRSLFASKPPIQQPKPQTSISNDKVEPPKKYQIRKRKCKKDLDFVIFCCIFEPGIRSTLPKLSDEQINNYLKRIYSNLSKKHIQMLSKPLLQTPTDITLETPKPNSKQTIQNPFVLPNAYSTQTCQVFDEQEISSTSIVINTHHNPPKNLSKSGKKHSKPLSQNETSDSIQINKSNNIPYNSEIPFGINGSIINLRPSNNQTDHSNNNSDHKLPRNSIIPYGINGTVIDLRPMNDRNKGDSDKYSDHEDDS